MPIFLFFFWKMYNLIIEPPIVWQKAARERTKMIGAKKKITMGSWWKSKKLKIVKWARTHIKWHVGKWHILVLVGRALGTLAGLTTSLLHNKVLCCVSAHEEFEAFFRTDFILAVNLGRIFLRHPSNNLSKIYRKDLISFCDSHYI